MTFSWLRRPTKKAYLDIYDLHLKCKCSSRRSMILTSTINHSFYFCFPVQFLCGTPCIGSHSEVPVVGSLEFHIPSSYRSWTAPLTAAGTSLSRAAALLATSYQITDGCKKGRKGKIRSKVNLLLSLPGEYQRVIYPSRTDVTLISHTS